LLFNNAVSNDTVSVDGKMINECGAIGGMRNGTGNQSTGRKSAPLVLCPSKIPHDLTWAAVVLNQQLTTCGTALPILSSPV
jgi:hypothetical protein